MTSVRFLKDPSGLVGSRSCGGTHEIRPICVITAQIQVGPHGGEHYLDPSFPPEHGKPRIPSVLPGFAYPQPGVWSGGSRGEISRDWRRSRARLRCRPVPVGKNTGNGGGGRGAAPACYRSGLARSGQAGERRRGPAGLRGPGPSPRPRSEVFVPHRKAPFGEELMRRCFETPRYRPTSASGDRTS